MLGIFSVAFGACYATSYWRLLTLGVRSFHVAIGRLYDAHMHYGHLSARDRDALVALGQSLRATGLPTAEFQSPGREDRLGIPVSGQYVVLHQGRLRAGFCIYRG